MLQWNFIMFKFSALSRIWKKFIQKTEYMGSALKTEPNCRSVTYGKYVPLYFIQTPSLVTNWDGYSLRGHRKIFRNRMRIRTRIYKVFVGCFVIADSV